ncbi:MAG: hypothetical protein NC339_01665 [Muribaculaceae bacterium]|nr:hypothetical protein [Muribaculaceae bacterium]
MAENLYQRVEAVKAKALLLTERYKALQQSKAQADRTIEELSATISGLERQIAEKDREIERLKVASVLVPDHNNVEETRTFIADLVREIDRCIARLSI